MMDLLRRWFGGREREGLVEDRRIDGVEVHIDRAPVCVALRASASTGALLAKPRLRKASRGMVPLALLAHKAKQFDDGLYAAVEIAASNGAGLLPGKRAWLAEIGRELAGGAPEPGVVTVLAAASLGAPGDLRLAKPMAAAVAAALARFEEDPARSKPMGFYTWSDDLRRIFRRDRMLAQGLPDAGLEAITAAVRDDAGRRAAYAAHLDLAAKLTNALAPGCSDLRGLLAGYGDEAPPGSVSLFPPARAHETDVAKEVLDDRPIPEGFSLADEMLRRVRAGALSLAPTATSGWYDWQWWALETLAAPDRAAEAGKLVLDDTYRAWLADLFRGLMALTRETHGKQLITIRVGAAEFAELPRTIEIGPDLRVEPHATFYLRRALGYRFVRGVLEAALGARALADLRRLRADGPVGASLAEELHAMEALFLGAYAVSSVDLGLPPSADPGAAAALPAFLTWRRKIAGDIDLSADARMMVPLFHDEGRGRTKVLAFLGWSEREITARFATPPQVEVRAPNVEVDFTSQREALLHPVTVELYVSKVLDRREMRALCDAKKTREAIVAALASR